MDYLFLLIENQSQTSKDNVSTVNSDVYNNMTHSSMNTFLKRKYDLLYQHLPTSDIILCPALHGNHWFPVVSEMKQKRMVYLDSLYNGVGALTAFTRFTNFLERVFVSQSKVIDWNM